MNNTVFITETPRLALRKLTEDDAHYFYELNLDPEVLQYTGDVAFDNTESAKIFLKSYQSNYKNYGLGRWAVIRKEDNAFLGWCGIKYSESSNEYDLGFRFFKKHWNKGYATEAAVACLELGFTKFNLNEIVGRAMKNNIASIRVLEKCGFTFSHPFDFEGTEGVLFSISKKR